MEIKKSAKLYMERKLPQYQDTFRAPAPQLYLPDNPVNYLPLKAPFPSAKLSYNRKYVDRGLSQQWPDGTCAECNQ